VLGVMTTFDELMTTLYGNDDFNHS
jgi:hypothetical protein